MKTHALVLGMIFLVILASNAFAVAAGAVDYGSYGYPTDYPFNYILANKFQLSGPMMFDFRFLSRYIPNGKPDILREGICVDDACYCKVRYGLHDNTSHVLPRDYQLYITHHNDPSHYGAPYGSHMGLYMDCGQSVYPPNPYYPGEERKPYVPTGNAYAGTVAPSNPLAAAATTFTGSQYGAPYSWSVAYDYVKNALGKAVAASGQPQTYPYSQFYGYGQANQQPFNQYTRDQAYDWSYPINNTYNAYQTDSSYQGPLTIGEPQGGQGGYNTTYAPGQPYYIR